MKDFKVNDLTKYFSELQKLCDEWSPIENKISYNCFTNDQGTLEGVGPVTVIDRLNQKVFDYNNRQPISITEDFAGLYMFLKDDEPFYCGISRNVIKRILDHQKGGTSSTATLAHRIAKNKYPDTSDKKYIEAFETERKNLLNCEISMIKFYDQDLDAHEQNIFAQHKEEVMLYLFEVFVSIRFNTKHNSFRTH